MPNPICECQLAGHCVRHNLNKSQHQWEMCKGIAQTVDCGRKYFVAWEKGLLGATAPAVPNEAPPQFCDPQEALSAWERVRSVVGVFASTAVQALTTGQALVSDEVRATRLAICQTCEHYSKGVCDLCGCSCNAANSLANKLAHATAACPLKPPKWGPSIPAGSPINGATKLFGIPIERDKLVSHILYHVMPLAGDTEWVWRKHLDNLREVRDQYNGRLIIGVVTPGHGDQWKYMPVDAVREAVAGMDAEIITAPNHVASTARGGKGENVLWPRLLEKVYSHNPNDVFFYGHCKGVSRPHDGPDKPPHLWAEAMFDTLFRNRDAAVDALDYHGCCGPFRMTGGFQPGLPGVGNKWFFSGTFFAMRSVDAFQRRWNSVPNYYGGVERMPQTMFSMAESACLFFDGVNNLYDAGYWRDTVTPAFSQWRAEHGTPRTA